MVQRPVAEITTPEVVIVLDAVAKLGHHETVSRLRSTAKRIFSHGRSRGLLTSNPAADLNDAFTAPKATPRPALTDPAAVAELLRRIDAYAGKGPLSHRRHGLLDHDPALRARLPHHRLDAAQLRT